MTELLKIKIFLYYLFVIYHLTVVTTNKISADQKIRITADEMQIEQEGQIIKAKGNAVAQDEKGLKMKSDLMLYDEKQSLIKADGNVILNDNDGNTYFFEKLETDNEIKNLKGINVRARLDDDSRIVGSRLIKKNHITSLEDAEYTPCLENDYLIENCPGWKLKANKIFQDNKTKTIHYDHARIHLFNIPVFYLPYFSHPDPSVNKRSGFLMPTVETDQNLGDVFSVPIFYNIKSNLDLTFTPTIHSKSNNFYSLNYRQLNDKGLFNIDTSIDDNDDNSGTSNHLFFDGNLSNPYGSLDVFLQTSNNDTYMRKNKINKLTVLKSGLSFEMSSENRFLSLDAVSYKHLAIQDGEQWEYVYPRVIYNIDNVEDKIFNGKLSINNQFDFNKDLNDNYTSLAASQINWNKNIIEKENGLVFENKANLRVVSISVDSKTTQDTDNIRFYPQISSTISLPLLKTAKILIKHLLQLLCQ